ncbi:TetR/AcrR family transcriptional regulator [Microbispora sp. NPDC049125]|uniref:TetR/AcrR family transcriptional regulator n=1 Tax=Microbispora sp. NPDC049125 TaxID=3154929 RepID=UPI0034666585
MTSGRPPRADALRNRARVLEVAHEVFAAEGLSVPIDEIARRAGVGAGTVYRHFPTKDALFTAIVVARIDRISARARSLATAGDPGQAFFDFFAYMVAEGIANKGLGEALAGAGVDVEALAAASDQELQRALADLLTRAQRAGAVRDDVGPREVKALMGGCATMERQLGASAPGRITTITCDGLRPPGARTPPG